MHYTCSYIVFSIVLVVFCNVSFHQCVIVIREIAHLFRHRLSRPQISAHNITNLIWNFAATDPHSAPTALPKPNVCLRVSSVWLSSNVKSQIWPFMLHKRKYPWISNYLYKWERLENKVTFWLCIVRQLLRILREDERPYFYITNFYTECWPKYR